MKPRYFVELLTRAGELKQRYAFSTLPITLGRGYDNDLILDDAHTAVHHAVIEADEAGVLVMRDLGSLNGMVNQGRRLTSMTLVGTEEIRLGQTHLRVRTADFSVTSTEIKNGESYRWEGWQPAVAGFGLMTLLALFSAWESATSALSAASMLLTVMMLLAMGLVWSGLWTIVNRLFDGHLRFGRHSLITGAGLLTIEIVEQLTHFLAYALAWDALSRYQAYLLLMLVGGVVYLHLITIKPNLKRRMLVTMSVLVVLAIGLQMMKAYQTTGRLTASLYMNELYAPTSRLTGDHRLDEFMSATAGLKAKADSRVDREADPDDGEDDEGDS